MILLLDMDETIIADACIGAELPSLALEYGAGDVDYVILRPGLYEFLDFAKENFSQIILCTFSPLERAEAFIKAAGLEDYFDEVYGGQCIIERYTGGEPPVTLQEDFLLLDDRGSRSRMIVTKMAIFGADTEIPAKIKERLVEIQPFYGDPHDEMLQKAISDLKERLTDDYN